MSTEMTFWDQVSLGLTLLFVVIYIALKIKKAFSSTTSGCSGCSGCSSYAGAASSCAKPPVNCDKKVKAVSIKEIKKIDVK